MTAAIRFTRPGPPSVLRLVPVEHRAPGPGDVLIAVEAAGVNNADLLERRGHYPVPADAPPGLGLECAGTITAVGREVRDRQVGDRVCALLAGGGYAEEVVVPAGQVLPVPRGLTMIEAASFPEVACTVYANLAMLAGLRRGQSVLVHGAGGGIGSFAIQWAAAIGATVITTAGSRAKVDAAYALGAHTAIDYRTGDFVTATLDATNGRGVDAVLDVVGADYLQRNLRCLAPDGHLVIIGGSATRTPLDLGELMVRRASVSATMLRGRPKAQKAEIVAGVIRDVLPLIEAGRIRPVIDSVFPLAQAGRAHELLESGRTVGKIILTSGAV
ncbi:NAD(P)H-quinone oxidoreductase [Nocardia jiangsuensis]|uniref:NAD(P)H-quinone oxidoreductase n=1 Tax=Nocardia jiangsuensis TaxID=1691563 RepID=A0ABV8DL63_9NOCA